MPAGALALAAVGWGTANTGTKYALRGFGPVGLLAVELLCAVAVLWAVVLVRGYRPGVPWRRVVALGLLEPALAYLAETEGLSRTTAANAALIEGLECAFVVVLAALVLSERITRSVGLATLVAAVGFVALETDGSLGGPGVGDLLVLGGALSAAAYTVVARGIGEDADPLTLTAQQFTVAAAAVVPVAAVGWVTGVEPAPLHVGASSWLVAALVGVGGYALSFVLYNTAIAVVPAAPAAVIVNLIPVVGLVTAVVLLDERLSPHAVVGAVLIAGSVAVFAVAEARAELRAEAEVVPVVDVRARVTPRWVLDRNDPRDPVGVIVLEGLVEQWARGPLDIPAERVPAIR